MRLLPSRSDAPSGFRSQVVKGRENGRQKTLSLLSEKNNASCFVQMHSSRLWEKATFPHCFVFPLSFCVFVDSQSKSVTRRWTLSDHRAHARRPDCVKPPLKLIGCSVRNSTNWAHKTNAWLSCLSSHGTLGNQEQYEHLRRLRKCIVIQNGSLDVVSTRVLFEKM